MSCQLQGRITRRGLEPAAALLSLVIAAGASLAVSRDARAQEETSPAAAPQDKAKHHRKPSHQRAGSETNGSSNDEARPPLAKTTAAPLTPTGATQRTPPAADAATLPAAQPAPSSAKPPAESSPATSPEKASGGATASPGAPVHAIEGAWKMYWYSENKTSDLRIAQVAPHPGVTNFVGALATLDGQVCPMTGNVVDNLTGSFTDGLENPSLTIPAFVLIHAQCPQKQVWVEALGLPSGKVLMNGRMTMIASNGETSHTSIGLGR